MLKPFGRPAHALRNLVGTLTFALLMVGGAPVFASFKGNLDPAVDLLARPAPATAHGENKRLIAVANFAQRIVAVGEMGLVIYSDDAGQTWQQAVSPTSVMLTAVTAVDATHGWAVGHDGVILSTQDAGATWMLKFDGYAANSLMLSSAKAQVEQAAKANGEPEQVELLQEAANERLADVEAADQAGPSQPLFGIAFTDTQHGFAVGAFGQVFETRDGGTRWAFIGDRLDNPEGLHLNAISRGGDGELFVAAEAGTLFISRDAGGSWTRVNLDYEGHIYGVLALTADTLVAYGFGGHLFVSGDRGEHWRSVHSPTGKAIVDAVRQADGTALLVNQDGQLIVSDKNGRSFLALGQASSLTRVSGMCASTERAGIFLVGANGIKRQALKFGMADR
ncbi:hypothetical protein FGE05_08885 [Pseudomonas sp. ICMP22404]|uniref:WD40/YVTN/BNR-like repeat-containing protein n=1 Tax=Pseudomonas sp. ICMP22404 TaxID=2583807 RepID=UPI00111A6209|nr:YCF48-related protein [Pseudomonas sp. ICMP22404]TNF83356.1 hypothetical protein FGE05_08885 [Pseudomonas sp. ICMP22404]